MRVNKLAMMLALLLGATQAYADNTTINVDGLTAPVLGQVTNWRRDIHAHPELSNREFRTSKIVADQLRKLGLDVQTGIAHTGVVGILKGGKPGPRVALRADMDALPVTEQVDVPFASKVTSEYRGEKVGVMHACGHDSHTAILLGVATALAGMRRDLPGEVMFIFQPAEEGAPEGEEGGASLLIKEGLFKNFKPDAVFGLHVWAALHAGEIGYRSGPFMAASDRFTILVKGEQTHGSSPWRGIDPIVTAAELITSAQTIVSRQIDITRQPAVVTFGAIKGGIRYNIIPDKVELVGTIRTFDEDMRQDIFHRLTRIAEHTAAANGASVETHIPADAGNPVTINNPALTARALPSLQHVAGTEHVREVALVTGAEDFAYYAHEAPALFFFVGATPKDRDLATTPSNHSPKFYLDESALDLGMRALTQVTLDFLSGANVTK